MASTKENPRILDARGHSVVEATVLDLVTKYGYESGSVLLEIAALFGVTNRGAFDMINAVVASGIIARLEFNGAVYYTADRAAIAAITQPPNKP